MTELRERARKQREQLERRMMGDSLDDEENDDGDDKNVEQESSGGSSSEDTGCSWGMGKHRITLRFGFAVMLDLIRVCVTS